MRAIKLRLFIWASHAAWVCEIIYINNILVGKNVEKDFMRNIRME
jgi:hypothetical protein